MCNNPKQFFNKVIVINNNLPNGLSVNIKKRGFSLALSLAKIQTCEGFTSKLSNGNHIILLDYDKCKDKDAIERERELIEFREKLRVIQRKYKDVNGHSLSNFYFFSDLEGSYRIMCFNEISFNVYTKILLEVSDYLDSLFVYYTIRNKKATIRISDKIGREPQKLIDSLTLVTYYLSIPLEKMEKACYDTVLNKNNIKIQLGNNGKICWG